MLREAEMSESEPAVIDSTNADGITALHQACIDENLEMVQFLVEHGANVNQSDNEGWTPLHVAASCGYSDIAEYLLQHGANVGAVNCDGDIPVDIAEEEGTEQLLKEYIRKQGEGGVYMGEALKRAWCVNLDFSVIYVPGLTCTVVIRCWKSTK
ncbi:PP12C phosphatase, partial [Polypterus senegalus]|nr:PP12C phosphatase [Polypterus senegalus]